MHRRGEGGQQDGVRDDGLDHRHSVDVEINLQQRVMDRGVVLAEDHPVQERCHDREGDLVEDEADDDLVQMCEYQVGRVREEGQLLEGTGEPDC